MGRWGTLVEACVVGIQSAPLTEDGTRPSITAIDNQIFQCERITASAASLSQTPTDRIREFRSELKARLSVMLKSHPHELWLQEALKLLENEVLRVPDNQRPAK